MVSKETYVPVENKGDWKTAALFWGGAIVAITSGSTAAAVAGVVLMGIGAWGWWKGKK